MLEDELYLFDSEDELSFFEEHDFIINLWNKYNVMEGAGIKSKMKKRKEKQKKKAEETRILKQASKNEGKRAKKTMKAEAQQKKADAKTAISDSKIVSTSNYKARVKMATEGISKEKIDALPRDQNYRTNLRKIVSEDIKKLDDAKIDEMMPKDLQVIIGKVEEGGKKMTPAEKRKILAEYKINMADSTSFKSGEKGFKQKMQQSIYNIHSIAHGRMSGIELPKKQQENTTTATKELNAKVGNVQNKGVGPEVNSRLSSVEGSTKPPNNASNSYKAKKNTLTGDIEKSKAEYEKAVEEYNLVKSFEDIKSTEDLNTKKIKKKLEIKKLKTNLETKNNPNNEDIRKLVKLEGDLKKLEQYDKLLKEKNIEPSGKATLAEFRRKKFKTLTESRNLTKKLNNLNEQNPDKTFEPEKFKKSIESFKIADTELNKKQSKLTELRSSLNTLNTLDTTQYRKRKNEITKLETEIKKIENSDVNLKGEQIGKEISKKKINLKTLKDN